MVNMNTTVDDALAAQPGLVSVFIRHRMICVGCAIAHFHTLREVAELYEITPDQFYKELARVLDPTPLARVSTSSDVDHTLPGTAASIDCAASKT